MEIIVRTTADAKLVARNFGCEDLCVSPVDYSSDQAKRRAYFLLTNPQALEAESCEDSWKGFIFGFRCCV